MHMVTGMINSVERKKHLFLQNMHYFFAFSRNYVTALNNEERGH